MLKAGNDIKKIYPHVKHITCLAHALHRASEAFRENNDFISLFKEIHHKNPSLKKDFYDFTKLNIPKYPVITRWGTWINFAIFISKNFSKIKSYFLHIYTKLSERKKKICTYFDQQNFKIALFEVLGLEILCVSIKKLEKNKIKCIEQVEIIESILNNCSIKIVVEKLKNSLIKNPDYNYFKNFYNLNPDEMLIHNYTTLTTSEIERSFSSMKFILNSKRLNMTVENLDKNLLIYYNKF